MLHFPFVDTKFAVAFLGAFLKRVNKCQEEVGGWKHGSAQRKASLSKGRPCWAVRSTLSGHGPLRMLSASLSAVIECSTQQCGTHSNQSFGSKQKRRISILCVFTLKLRNNSLRVYSLIPLSSLFSGKHLLCMLCSLCRQRAEPRPYLSMESSWGLSRT